MSHWFHKIQESWHRKRILWSKHNHNGFTPQCLPCVLVDAGQRVCHTTHPVLEQWTHNLYRSQTPVQCPRVCFARIRKVVSLISVHLSGSKFLLWPEEYTFLKASRSFAIPENTVWKTYPMSCITTLVWIPK